MTCTRNSVCMFTTQCTRTLSAPADLVQSSLHAQLPALPANAQDSRPIANAVLLEASSRPEPKSVETSKTLILPIKLD